MALRKKISLTYPYFPPLGFSLCPAALQLLLQTGLFIALAATASAQTSQQYVYGSVPGSPSSAVTGFSKAGQTGALSLVPGSPFNERLEGGLMAVDGQGRFLFVLNPTSSEISMFQIDQASGALSEVPASPFAVPPFSGSSIAPSQPLSIAAERSGNFLFVGYFGFGGSQGPASIVSLAIDTSGSSPVLVAIQNTLTNTGGAPIQLLTDSKGLHLYVGLSFSPGGTPEGGAEVYSIDSTGNLFYQGLAASLLSFGTGYAIDPQDRFFFAGGGNVAFVENCLISPVDGTANTCSPAFYLGFQNSGMLTESSGHFLYIGDTGGKVAVYSLDQTTGTPTQLGSVNGITLAQGTSVADPMGPFIYSTDQTLPAAVHAYQVDQQTGNLTEISGSPFSTGITSAGCCQGLAISGTSVQAVSGPAVAIFPSTAATFTATAGTSSPTQIFSIVNTGTQLLAINSISIAGPDASSFSQSNTCLATLAPNASCSVSITFNPATAGTFTASLQVADNAPGSPQTLALNGTGLAPQPAVTFSPAALSFPGTNQGATSPAQTLTVISSGNAALNISSISVAGPNPSDFSLTNNCTAPLAPGANCPISVVFTPTASGQRTANLLIYDDALGSPQTVVLTGTGIALLPALTFSPPVPSFPPTTQGTSSPPQTLTVTNSGNAPLQISSVSLGGSGASGFSVAGNCTAPLAPAASCAISLVFSPLVSGQTVASLIVADDAPGSPQTISLSATANPAFSVIAASGSSLSASVSAGQSAQYQLQITPGTGFSGTVSLSCAGAPLGAVCQLPVNVTVANGAATPFNVTVTTSGPALLPPSTPLHLPRMPRVPSRTQLWLVPLLLFLLWLFKNHQALERATCANRLALRGAFSVAVFCSALSLAGCGGGSAAVAVGPSQIVTPSGTSTMTISLGANSLAGQPLQLQPIQLTLTVR